MESLRSPLTAGFLKRIEKELGEEVTLGLLWPQAVGPELARNTRLKAIRRGTLIVAVPDRAWLNPLGSLDQMILESIARLGTGRKYDAVEFVVSPAMAAQCEEANAKGGIPHPPGKVKPATATESDKNQTSGLDLDARIIGDEKIRSLFRASAKKYFARRGRGEA